MHDTVVETHGLRRQFGEKVAVADLSLSLRQGEIFGFLGPNGAGKTTSLKMLLGLIEPSGGRGRLLGEPIGHREARARVGFLPEHFRFQDWLTARELLWYHGRLVGLGGADLRRRTEDLLARVDLLEAADRKLREYSKGMLQRAGLAAALLNDPLIVFLDEPTSGLDPLGRLLVRDLMKELKTKGVTVFLNSHLLGEVEQTCDRVVFLKQGRVVHEHVLGAQDGACEVELRAEGLGPAGRAALARHGAVREEGDTLVVRVAGADAAPEIAHEVVAAGARLHHLTARRTSLEAMFLQVMGDDGRPG